MNTMHRLPQRSLMASAMLALLAMSAGGCSVAMAAKQPGRKNVDVMSQGMPRNMVLAELGQPITAEKKDGKRVDVFSFVQGYRKGVRVGRTLAHGTADVLTLGLWEVVGTPTEATFDGKPIAFEVTYDAHDRVETVVPLMR